MSVFSEIAHAKASNLEQKILGKPLKDHLYEFCLVIALVSLIVLGFFIYKNHEQYYPATIAAAALLLSRTAPTLILPLWKVWMLLAQFLGMVMTLLIISLVWAIVFIPMALLLRIISKKVMDLTFDRSVKTYWRDRKPAENDFSLLERQF